MGLSIAFKQEEFFEPRREPKEKTRRISKQEARVNLRIARLDERDYQEVLAERREDLIKIQKYFPGWMPDND